MLDSVMLTRPWFSILQQLAQTHFHERQIAAPSSSCSVANWPKTRRFSKKIRRTVVCVQKGFSPKRNRPPLVCCYCCCRSGVSKKLHFHPSTVSKCESFFFFPFPGCMGPLQEAGGCLDITIEWRRVRKFWKIGELIYCTLLFDEGQWHTSRL